MRLLPLALVTLVAAGVGWPASTAEGPPLVTLEAHCHPGVRNFAAMETDYYLHGCWGHWGHHTYFVGRDRVYGLDNGWARVFSVEQQLSPPASYNVSTSPPQVTTPIPIEISLDGTAWEQVATANYRFAGLPLELRMWIYIRFEADQQPFRFLRFREPESVAQGLSGYLDHSIWILNVTDLGPAPQPALFPGSRALTCRGDILEDIFETHPCWFGTAEHWDAPSWFHTYFLENATLDRIRGNATLRYFRPDDPGQPIGGILGGTLLVQRSTDGVRWTTVASVPSTYEQRTAFDVGGLGGVEAKFVRIVSGKHPGWTSPASHPALKHPEAFLVESDLRLDGHLPPPRTLYAAP